jgi:hypothetical protein
MPKSIQCHCPIFTTGPAHINFKIKAIDILYYKCNSRLEMEKGLNTMNKLLLSLTLLLSCLCQARLEVSFNQLSELPKILKGQTEAQLMITISESDIKDELDWEDCLTQSIKSLETTQIDLKLDLPKSATEIGSYFLAGCTGLTAFELPESVTKIGDGFLASCTNLTSFELPESVTKINDNFLDSCTGLISLELHKSVTKIGDEFLYGCAKLTSFELPDSVTTIGDLFLSGCTELTRFELPDSVITIGDGFLACCGLTRFELPNSVTKIGDSFLDDCTELNFVKLSSSITTIGDQFLFDLKNIEIHLILDRIDNVYFRDPNEISDMSESQQKNCLQTKGSGRILWNGEKITPEEVYKKGHIINFTVPNRCTLCLLPKKHPKKPVMTG